MGEFKGYAPYFQAGVIVAVIFFVPEGITSLFTQIASWVRERQERRRTSKYAS
jgi:hypothetical protein